MRAPDFAHRVIAWQAIAGRHGLPWQQTRDPYRVWLSEVMLQQTQVTTVLRYYERFLARFPDVHALARADLDEVLGFWSGLGYYSRARLLHRCAQVVCESHGGVFPHSACELERLPGIGRSTAAAIASICFGEPVSILDGNVRRLLARHLGFDADLSLARHVEALWAQAQALVPTDDPQKMPVYTQGLMDLGALVCLQRKPRCAACPVAADCRARADGDPERLPVRRRKARRTDRTWWLLWLERADGAVWLERRPAAGIWGGLHCMPVFDRAEDLQEAVRTRLAGRLVAGACLSEAGGEAMPPLVHPLTHLDLRLQPVRWRLPAGETLAGMACDGHAAWYPREAWVRLGLPAPIRQWLGCDVASSSR